jgi:pentatricopeptide repeat protein
VHLYPQDAPVATLAPRGRPCVQQSGAHVQVWDDMRASGVEPNSYVYVALINACEHASDWRRAVRVFYAMRVRASHHALHALVLCMLCAVHTRVLPACCQPPLWCALRPGLRSVSCFWVCVACVLHPLCGMLGPLHCVR